MSWSALCARRVHACLLLSLLAGPPAVAQPDTAQATAAYLSLLQRYESGDYEIAARAALTLNPEAAHQLGQLVIIEDIKTQIVQLKRLKATSKQAAPTEHLLTQFRRERFRRLRLTVLVHTEAALRLAAPEPLGDQLTLARGWVTTLRDLDADEWGSLEQDDWAGRQRFVRDWYLVVASHLQAADQPRYLKGHVTSGLGLFRDDPELLLARGSISESEADVATVASSPAAARSARRRTCSASDWGRQPLSSGWTSCGRPAACDSRSRRSPRARRSRSGRTSRRTAGSTSRLLQVR